MKTFEFIVENQTLIEPYFNIFNAIASFFKNATYLEILKIAFLLGGFYAFLIAISSIFGMSLTFRNTPIAPFKRFTLLISYVLGVLFLLIMSYYKGKADIIVKTNNIDTYCSLYAKQDYHSMVANNKFFGGAPTNGVVISNIPYLWAWIFTSINETGRSLTNFANASFMDTKGTQINRGNYVDYLQAASGILSTKLSDLSPTATMGKYDMITVIEAVKKDCISIPASKAPFLSEDILDGVNKSGDIVRTLDGYFTKGEIRLFKNPTDPTGSLISKGIEIDGTAPGNYLVTVGDDTYRCKALWDNFKKDVEAIDKEQSGICHGALYAYLTPENLSIFTGDRKTKISAPQTNNIILQSAMINQFMEQKSKLPSEIVFASGKSMAQITLNSAGTGFYMAKMLPYIQMSLRAVLYAFFPFIFIIMIFPYGLRVMGQYLRTLIWIELWMPIAAVLNMFIMFGISEKFKLLYDGAGLNIVNSVQVFSEAFIMAGVAGYLFAFVPAIAWLILKGSDQMLGRITANGLAQVAANFESQTINEDVRALSRTQEYNTLRRQKGQELVSMAEQDMQRAGIKGKQIAGGFLAKEENSNDLSKATYGATTDIILGNIGKYNVLFGNEVAQEFTKSVPSMHGIGNISEKQALGFINSDGNFNEKNIAWAGKVEGIGELVEYRALERLQSGVSIQKQIQAASFGMSKALGDSLGILESTKTGLYAILDNAKGTGNKELEKRVRNILSKDNFSIIRDGHELFAAIGVYGRTYQSLSDDVKSKILTDYGINSSMFGNLEAISYSFNTLTYGEFLQNMFQKYDDSQRLKDDKYESILYEGEALSNLDKNSRLYKSIQGFFTLTDLKASIQIRDSLAKNKSLESLGGVGEYAKLESKAELFRILKKAEAWDFLTDGGKRPLADTFEMMQELEWVKLYQTAKIPVKTTVGALGVVVGKKVREKIKEYKPLKVANEYLEKKSSNAFKTLSQYSKKLGVTQKMSDFAKTPAGKFLLENKVARFVGEKGAKGLKYVSGRLGTISGGIAIFGLTTKTEIYQRIKEDTNLRQSLIDFGFLSESAEDRDILQLADDIVEKGGARLINNLTDLRGALSRYNGHLTEAKEFSRDMSNYNKSAEELLMQRILERMFINKMDNFMGGSADSYQAIREYLIASGLVKVTRDGLSYEPTEIFNRYDFNDNIKDVVDVYMNPYRKAEALVYTAASLEDRGGIYGRDYTGFRNSFAPDNVHDFFSNLSSDRQLFTMATVLFGGFNADNINNVRLNYREFINKASSLSSAYDNSFHWGVTDSFKEYQKNKASFNSMQFKANAANPERDFFQIILNSSDQDLRTNFQDVNNLVDLNLIVDNITRLIALGELSEQDEELAKQALQKIAAVIPMLSIPFSSFKDVKKFDKFSDWADQRGYELLEYDALLQPTNEAVKNSLGGNIRTRADEGWFEFADVVNDLRNANDVESIRSKYNDLDKINSDIGGAFVSAINSFTEGHSYSAAVYAGDDREANSILMNDNYWKEQGVNAVYGIVGETAKFSGQLIVQHIELPVREMVATNEFMTNFENSISAKKAVIVAKYLKEGGSDTRGVVSQVRELAVEKLNTEKYTETEKSLILDSMIKDMLTMGESKIVINKEGAIIINKEDIQYFSTMLDDLKNTIDTLHDDGKISTEVYYKAQQEILQKSHALIAGYMLIRPEAYKNNQTALDFLYKFHDDNVKLHKSMSDDKIIEQGQFINIQQSSIRMKLAAYYKFKFDKEVDKETYFSDIRRIMPNERMVLKQAVFDGKMSHEEYIEKMGKANKNTRNKSEKIISGIEIGFQDGVFDEQISIKKISDAFKNKDINEDQAMDAIQFIEARDKVSAIAEGYRSGILNKERALYRLEELHQGDFYYNPKDLALANGYNIGLFNAIKYEEYMSERYPDKNERLSAMFDTGGITKKEYTGLIFLNNKFNISSSLEAMDYSKNITVEDKIDFIKNHQTESNLEGIEYDIAFKEGIIDKERHSAEIKKFGERKIVKPQVNNDNELIHDKNSKRYIERYSSTD